MPPKVTQISDYDADKLFKEDLKKSGITRDRDIEKHRLVMLNGDETDKLSNYKTPSTAFVYTDINGEDTDFVRLKFLRPPPKSSWPTEDKPGKYWQPPNTTSRLYFPACRDWKSIKDNATEDVFITEGEKKAICASLNGLNCLAIAGVSNWKSSKRFNQHTIPDMDLIQWEQRRVYLCFDADMIQNVHVTKQLNDLSAELTDRGVRVVKVVELPADTELGPKCGLDDFIQRYGMSSYQKLIDKASDVKDTAELWRLNENFAFVDKMNCVYDFTHHQWISKAAFFDLTAPIKLTRIRVRGTGDSATVQADPVPANAAWWEWRCRRTYAKHAYLPGDPSSVDSTLNMWRGYPYRPRAGTIKPFEALIEHVAGTLTYDQKLWFWQWLAWPLQHPDECKMMSGVMVHSACQGSGKSLIGEILAELYGDNAVTVGSPQQMFSPFNEWIDNRQMVIADEVLVGSRSETDRVKNYITSPTHFINPKGIKAYEADAKMNWYLTSNHDNALKLTSFDRRWFVVHGLEQKLPEKTVKSLATWRRMGGVGYLMHFLQNEIDLGSFSRWAAPPETLARDSMIAASASEAESWCQQLRDDPDAILSVDRMAIPCDLFTEADWKESNLIPKSLSTVSTTTIRNILRSLGFEQRKRITSKTHWPSGEKKLWCLRHSDFWRAQDNDAWAEHYALWLKSSNRYQGLSKISANPTPRLKGPKPKSHLPRKSAW